MENGRRKAVSIGTLQNKFGEIEWGDHVRLITEETKVTSYKEQPSMTSSSQTSTSTATVPMQAPVFSASSSVVSSSLHPHGPDEALGVTLDGLFKYILDNIESQNWQNAKQGVLELQLHLKVTSGRESRSRGGWRYSCDFILDTVLFADVLTRLQEDEDVMTKAITLTLCLHLSFLLCWGWLELEHSTFCLSKSMVLGPGPVLEIVD